MKLTLIFLFILFVFAGCDSVNTTKKEKELEQKELELQQREIALQEQQSHADEARRYQQDVIKPAYVKYIYVVIKTNEPKIESEKMDLPPDPVMMERAASIGAGDGLMPSTTPPQFLRDPVYVKRAVSQYFTYKSDIVAVPNYSEDNRYIEIDKYQKKIDWNIDIANGKLQIDDQFLQGGRTNAEAKIISKESYIFDSYREASLHRDANN